MEKYKALAQKRDSVECAIYVTAEANSKMTEWSIERSLKKGGNTKLIRLYIPRVYQINAKTFNLFYVYTIYYP